MGDSFNFELIGKIQEGVKMILIYLHFTIVNEIEQGRQFHQACHFKHYHRVFLLTFSEDILKEIT